jgi:hypothetical protein
MLFPSMRCLGASDVDVIGSRFVIEVSKVPCVLITYRFTLAKP